MLVTPRGQHSPHAYRSYGPPLGLRKSCSPMVMAMNSLTFTTLHLIQSHSASLPSRLLGLRECKSPTEMDAPPKHLSGLASLQGEEGEWGKGVGREGRGWRRGMARSKDCSSRNGQNFPWSIHGEGQIDLELQTRLI
jgi:hypothetical protein